MASLSDRYAEYRCARGRALAELAAGGAAPGGLEAIDARFEDLTSGDALDELRADLEAARFDDARRSRAALLHLVEDAVCARVLAPLDTELGARAASELRVGRERRSAGEWRGRLAEESDAERRVEIQRALDAADAEARELRAERFALEAAQGAKLGHPSRAAQGEARRPDTSLEHWERLADTVLDRTESAFASALGQRLRELRIPAPHRAHKARLLRLPEFDRHFPQARLAPAFALCFETWRLDPAALGGVRVREDTQATRVIAARVPEEVWLLLAAGRGAGHYRAGFGASLEACALAFASAELPIERRLSADTALRRAWRRLGTRRLADPAWRASWSLGAHAEAFARAVRLAELFELRRAAGRVRALAPLARLAEGADPAPLAEVWRLALRDATGLDRGDHDFLAASDVFEAVDELRAACLVAQLEESLRARGGRAFWRDRACGELLKEVWHTGTTYSAEALAGQLDLGPLDPEPAIAAALGSGDTIPA